MIQTAFYDAPYGRYVMAAEDGALTGLWLEGQKYFPSDLPEPSDGESEIFARFRRRLDAYFAAYPAYRIPSAGKEARVRNGGPITDSRVADGTYRVYGADGTFLCLSRAKGGCLTAIKNFFGT